MNITEVRNRFVPKFDESAALAVQAMFQFSTEDAKTKAEECYVSDKSSQPFAGSAFVIAEVPGFPELSAEGIVSPAGGDWIITTYQKNPVFADKSLWIKARQESILELSRLLQALPSSVALRDDERGRDLSLAELSTAQLLDTIDMARAGTLNRQQLENV